MEKNCKSVFYMYCPVQKTDSYYDIIQLLIVPCSMYHGDSWWVEVWKHGTDTQLMASVVMKFCSHYLARLMEACCVVCSSLAFTYTDVMYSVHVIIFA